MKKSVFYPGTLLKSTLLSLFPFAFVQSAMSAITVQFEEEGSNVRVSFSGTIDLTGAPGTVAAVTPFTFADTGNVGSSSAMIVRDSYIEELGVASPSALNFASTSGFMMGADAFGFSFEVLRWSDRHRSGGVVGNVTALTADPNLDYMVFSGQSFASLGADSIAQGTVLWTSNGTAGDQFVFSRVEPVPEPSVGLLGGVALLGLLRRRR